MRVFHTSFGSTLCTESELKSDWSDKSVPSLVQRSIQGRRQQQKSLDSFLINIDHEENLITANIEIFYRSINDNSLLHLTELGYNQILVLTCENEQNYRNKLANSSIWLCTTFNEVRKTKFFFCYIKF